MMIVFKYLVYFFVLMSGEAGGSSLQHRDELEKMKPVKMEVSV